MDPYQAYQEKKSFDHTLATEALAAGAYAAGQMKLLGKIPVLGKHLDDVGAGLKAHAKNFIKGTQEEIGRQVVNSHHIDNAFKPEAMSALLEQPGMAPIMEHIKKRVDHISSPEGTVEMVKHPAVKKLVEDQIRDYVDKMPGGRAFNNFFAGFSGSKNATLSQDQPEDGNAVEGTSPITLNQPTIANNSSAPPTFDLYKSSAFLDFGRDQRNYDPQTHAKIVRAKAQLARTKLVCTPGYKKLTPKERKSILEAHDAYHTALEEAALAGYGGMA